jgi:DNA-binding transcriptional MerR regulator
MKPAAAVLYTTGEAVRVTGVPIHNVDYWARIGLLIPAVAAEGTGSIRGYTFNDLLLLKICGVLGDMSVEPRRAVVEKVRQYLTSPAVRAGQIDEWIHIRISQYCELVLYVEAMRREVQRAISQLASEAKS